MDRPPRGGPMLRQVRLENTEESKVAASAVVAAAARKSFRIGGIITRQRGPPMPARASSARSGAQAWRPALPGPQHEGVAVDVLEDGKCAPRLLGGFRSELHALRLQLSVRALNVIRPQRSVHHAAG